MVASPAVFAEKMPILFKNVKAKILITDFARVAIMQSVACTNIQFLSFTPAHVL